jgi:hypothetical protein
MTSLLGSKKVKTRCLKLLPFWHPVRSLASTAALQVSPHSVVSVVSVICMEVGCKRLRSTINRLSRSLQVLGSLQDISVAAASGDAESEGHVPALAKVKKPS